MSFLDHAAEDYLRVRRALGFKLEMAGRLLPQFIDYLQSVGEPTITTSRIASTPSCLHCPLHTGQRDQGWGDYWPITTLACLCQATNICLAMPFISWLTSP